MTHMENSASFKQDGSSTPLTHPAPRLIQSHPPTLQGAEIALEQPSHRDGDEHVADHHRQITEKMVQGVGCVLGEVLVVKTCDKDVAGVNIKSIK